VKPGNILWDCVSLIDSDTVARIQALGGISAIAISHPHYYFVDGRVEPSFRRRADLPSRIRPAMGPRPIHVSDFGKARHTR